MAWQRERFFYLVPTLTLHKATFARASIEDVTLKDGIFIPKGTKIEIAAGAIDRDPNKWPNPLSFDATRHLKARERPGHEHKHTFVSTSADDLVSPIIPFLLPLPSTTPQIWFSARLFSYLLFDG